MRRRHVAVAPVNAPEKAVAVARARHRRRRRRLARSRAGTGTPRQAGGGGTEGVASRGHRLPHHRRRVLALRGTLQSVRYRHRGTVPPPTHHPVMMLGQSVGCPDPPDDPGGHW